MIINLVRSEGLTDKEFKLIEFLIEQRILLVKNDMKKLVGLEGVQIPKEKIIETVKQLNTFANANGIAFHVDEEWKDIEFFLRSSILDDLKNEVQKQKNQIKK